MFSQSEIEEWLKIGSEDHLEANDKILMTSVVRESNFIDQKKNLKRFLLELTTQIERWDLVTDYFICHPALEVYLLETLDTEIHYSLEGPTIWMTTFIFSTHVPLNNILAVDTKTFIPMRSNSIAIGELDLKLIERINNLKAFW